MEGISLSQDYIIGEGDVLKIEIYDHPDLSTTAQVSGDGMIHFPLIGQVGVGRKTVSEISKNISTLLSDGYIIDPQVSIFILEFRSKKATIIGQVKKPGLYVLSRHTTFLELLSNAGGLTEESGDSAILRRKPQFKENKENFITIDLRRLIQEGDTSLDIEITDNDSIYIMKAGIFYVTGEVKNPSAHKYEEGMTVVKATTLAGGFTDKASDSRIKIIRNVDGKEVVIKNVKMDEPVLPDDVIVIPESFF
jgi:polysaccharide export outer membrane protein